MKKCFFMFCRMFLLVMGMLGLTCSVPCSNPAEAGFDTGVRECVAVAATCFDLTDGGEVIKGSGTCFFVGEKNAKVEYLVTNHHVVDTFLERGGGEEVAEMVLNGATVTGKWKVRVYFDSSDFEEAYIVDYDAQKDIALLKLDIPTDKRKALTLCSPTNNMIGSNVYAVGYPGLSENTFADSTTTWGMSDASVTSGTVSRLFTTSGTGVKRIQTDAVIQHGNSGGPLVNQNGSVIGVNSNAYNRTETDSLYSETDYYAVNIDEVIPMLKIHDVKYVMENAGGSGKIAILLIIAAAVLFVIAIVIVIVVLTTKKKNAEKQAQAQAQAIAQAQAAARAQAAAQAQQKPVKKPSVRSMAAQHNGARFAVNGQILIGRDASACAVVFQQNTPGISGRHCSLSYDAASDDFILTDLQSSYGTFLANGQKLSAGVPYHLRAGEHFYLGDNANILCVELE